ncbi:LysR family transcriptional regulator [Paraburkholderia xenovorans]|uniref:LysR family transcriptional regulator n=1 Tax=Paraburkholderia xenovorans TaxID=36873 RepID=UPI0038BB65D3
MNQIHAMRVFITVAETRSFRRAAQQLAVSNALVTRSIAMLEARLQTRLINRTTRNVALTDAGKRYLEGCRGVLEEFDQLEKTLVQSEQEPTGTLSIVATASLSLPTLTPLFDGYRRRYPKVKVRLTLAESYVDVVNDGYEDRYDVGIVTSAPAAREDLVHRPIGSNALALCASPGYLNRWEEPLTPDELASHSFVALPDAEQDGAWKFIDSLGQSQLVKLRPVYTVNSALMVRQAALAGMGIAILPSQLVADDLTAGTLNRVMKDYRFDDPDGNISVVYRRRQYVPPKTRSFVDYTVEYFERGKRAPAEAVAHLTAYSYDAAED